MTASQNQGNHRSYNGCIPARSIFILFFATSFSTFSILLFFLLLKREAKFMHVYYLLTFYHGSENHSNNYKNVLMAVETFNGEKIAANTCNVEQILTFV